MSRTLSRLLFVSLFAFAGALLINPSPGSRSTAGNSAPPQGVRVVEVTFDGLMIFTEVVESGRRARFEVGILDPSTAHGHELKIIRTKPASNFTDLKLPSKLPSNNWRLEVKTEAGGSTSPDIGILGTLDGCRDRLSKTNDESWDFERAFDFCWVIDFEREFMGRRPISTRPGKLVPIIEMYNGQLYTKFKYDELVQELRPTTIERDYGFVAETVALQVRLLPDQKLVMTVPGGISLFELSEHGEAAHILNIRDKRKSPPIKKKGPPVSEGRCRPDEDTHFVSYYKLLHPAPSTLGADICRKENARRPLNRYHRDRTAPEKLSLLEELRRITYDDYACGTVFLGISKNPLK